jgi:serine/threonine protein kinase
LLANSSSKITRPEAEVLDYLQIVKPSAFLTCSTPKQALYWYDLAKTIPGTPTKGLLAEKLGYIADGPVEELPDFIKVFKNSKEFLLKMKLTDTEADAAELFRGGPFIVPCEFVHVVSDAGEDVHELYGLVMPRYFRALCSMTYNLEYSHVLERCKDMIAAVNHIHSRNYVHMDIKDANIFVKDDEWFLGDFGTCVEYESHITGTTPGLYPLKYSEIMSGYALWHYDWFMLAVAIVTHLPNNTPLLYDDRNATDFMEVVIGSINTSCGDEELKLILLQLVNCHDSAFDFH